MTVRTVRVDNVKSYELRELNIDLEHVKRELGYEIEFCYYAYNFIVSNMSKEDLDNAYYLETDIANACIVPSKDDFNIKLEDLDVVPVLVKDNVRYIIDIEELYRDLSLEKLKEFEISKKIKHITRVSIFNIASGLRVTPLEYRIDEENDNAQIKIDTDFIHYGCECYALNTMIDMSKSVEKCGHTFRLKPFRKREDIYGKSIFL